MARAAGVRPVEELEPENHRGASCGSTSEGPAWREMRGRPVGSCDPEDLHRANEAVSGDWRIGGRRERGREGRLITEREREKER